MKRSMDKLCVSEDGKRLCHEDGRVFFYLADTAWELFHKLNREEAERYLSDRAEKGFTVIQAAVLTERDGMRRSNAYGRLPAKITEDGRIDPLQPDLDGEYSYWAHVDWIIKRAGEMGLYVALAPAWGDKFEEMRGDGPHVFSPENSYEYGRWLGERYAEAGNIIWILGGNREFKTRRQMEALNRMACGLKEGDGGRYLLTMHPADGQSSSESVHSEKWLDFNMIHSGHARRRLNFEMIQKDNRRRPRKPTLDGESGYEGIPDELDPANGYLDEADVRRNAYWAVLSGACGHAYGHHSIANFTTLPDKDTRRGYFVSDWRDALQAPGGGQMKYLRELMESVPFLEGGSADGLICENSQGMNHVAALKGEKWLVAYTPNGVRFELAIPAEWGGAKAAWFNPRNGETSDAFSVKAGRVSCFVPPSAGRGNDWALIIR